MIDPGRPPLVAWLHRNDRLALRLLPWVVGTALALGLAGALGGLEAFGLTIGVLAAAQAVWGGWRIEAAAKRIDRRAKAEDKAALVSALVDAERTVGRWAEAMDSASPGRRQADVFRKAGPEIQAARAVLVVARIRVPGHLETTERALGLMLPLDFGTPETREEVRGALERARNEATLLLLAYVPPT